MKWTNSLVRSVRSQLQISLKLSLLVSIPTVIFIGLMLYLSRLNHIPFSVIVQDPASTTGAPPYTGMLSNIGALLWNAAAAICFFASYVLHMRGQDREFTEFFLWSGIFTAALLIDDFFMFHDSILYVYFHINENLVYVAYAVAIVTYLVRYRSTMQKTPLLIFAVAMAFFVLSTVADKIPGLMGKFGIEVALSDDLLDLSEEGPKLFAIVNWLAYYALTAVQRLQAAFESL